MPHSVSEFIRFYNSPFSYWCNKTNKLVDEKKIDAKYKIQINATKLISKQLLTKAQEHEVVLKDKYRISENLNVVDMSNKDSSNNVFLEELEKNLENHRQILLQAPTGLGKTMGVLFPALKQSLSFFYPNY